MLFAGTPSTSSPFHFPQLHRRPSSVHCRAANYQQKGAGAYPVKKRPHLRWETQKEAKPQADFRHSAPNGKRSGQYQPSYPPRRIAKPPSEFRHYAPKGRRSGQYQSSHPPRRIASPPAEVFPSAPKGKRPGQYQPSHSQQGIAKPPAGFVVDDDGNVLLASNKRLISIVDPLTNRSLECVIRRVFQSSGGDECMLLCPVDMPVQFLRSTNFDGWSAIDEEEASALIPTASYALAKIHLHLVISGFCLTARGGFCYLEEDILSFNAGSDEDDEASSSEGVEIIGFQHDGAQYMIYTPIDPQLFVAVKNQDGILQIANDDLLEDPGIIDAIDEEAAFNALVEEEEAILES